MSDIADALQRRFFFLCRLIGKSVGVDCPLEAERAKALGGRERAAAGKRWGECWSAMTDHGFLGVWRSNPTTPQSRHLETSSPKVSEAARDVLSTEFNRHSEIVFDPEGLDKR